jgi:hypothetical protein
MRSMVEGPLAHLRERNGRTLAPLAPLHRLRRSPSPAKAGEE